MQSCDNSAIDWRNSTHAFVRFCDDSESTSVIPMSRVSFKEDNEGVRDCLVKWTNGKLYDGCLLFAGTQTDCQSKQDEYDESDETDMEEHDEADNGMVDVQAAVDNKMAKKRSRNEKEDKPKKQKTQNGKENKKTEKESKKTEKDNKNTGMENKKMGKESKKTGRENKKKNEDDEGFKMFVGKKPPRKPLEPVSDNEGKILHKRCKPITTEAAESEEDVESEEAESEEVESEEKESMRTIPSVQVGRVKKVQKVWVNETTPNREVPPIHYTSGTVPIEYEEMLDEMRGIRDDLTKAKSDQNLMITNIRSDLLQLNTKMESIRRTVVAVLAKELAPQTRTPAIIPLTNTSTPLLGAAAALPPTNPVMSPHNVVTSPPVVTCINLTSTPPMTSTPVVTSPMTSTPVTSPMTSTSAVTFPMMSIPAVTSPPMMSTPAVTSTPSITPTPAVTSPPVTSTALASTTIETSMPTVMPTCVTSTTAIISTPSTPLTNPAAPEVLTFTPEVSRDFEIDTSIQHFISLPELTQIFNKSCSRRNMAVNLVRRLFDKDTRLKSNVSGRGKEMLDPVLVSYAKNMCFQFFPLMPSEKLVEEWNKCVISIDESSRRLKNKPNKKDQ